MNTDELIAEREIKTRNYLEYVIREYGENQMILEGPPGPIYGKAGDLLRKWMIEPFHIPGI